MAERDVLQEAAAEVSRRATEMPISHLLGNGTVERAMAMAANYEQAASAVAAERGLEAKDILDRMRQNLSDFLRDAGVNLDG